MTAIFEKVELASSLDLAAVRALLDAKVAEYLQVRGVEAAAEARAAPGSPTRVQPPPQCAQDKGAGAPEAVREALVAVSVSSSGWCTALDAPDAR
jgi:hypothetical protein